MGRRKDFHLYVLLALAFVVVLGACEQAGEQAGPTERQESPAGTEETPSPTQSPSPETTPASRNGGELPADWARCRNASKAYSIGYPQDWHSDEARSQEACRWFNPQPFQVETGQDPPVVAMTVKPAVGTYENALEHVENPYGARTVMMDEVSIGGRQAVRFETVETEELEHPRGTRTYGYVIDRRGTAFYVETKNVAGNDTAYNRNKRIVDEAVKTLRFLEEE